MKKLFSKSKSLIAYLTVFAILAVSVASAFTGLVVSAVVDSTYDQWSGEFDTQLAGDGTKESPYLITSAEELAAVCYAKVPGSQSGAYFKVSGITEFYLDSVTAPATVKGFNSATEVSNYYKNISTAPATWAPSATVTLNFDGNGATIYGMYVNGNSICPGLFAIANENTVIENIAIKNSYIYSTINDGTGNSYGGFILGNGKWNSSGTITIKNCIIKNNYCYSVGGLCGEVIGHGGDTKIVIDSCLVADNVMYYNANFHNLPYQYYGRATNGNKDSVVNCIGIDVVPQIRSCAGDYNNNYYVGTVEHSGTDITRGVTKLSSADKVKGVAAATNMTGLDKNNWFFNTVTYPEPVVFHQGIEFADNGDGTHGMACDCGMISAFSSAHVIKEDGKCECGFENRCGAMGSVYSGTPDTTTVLSGTGTQNDPYIIKTADQFAAVALGAKKYAQGSYFKVDPSIDAFYMNGGKTVAAMTNVADVEAYFEANGGYDWASSWSNANADEAFSGHFDGSGVTIYGLYDVGYNAGLFEMVEDESSFKNFALKNSYIKVGSGAGVAAIVGKGSKQTTPDITTIENVVVANNHIEQTNSGAGVGASVMIGYIYNMGSNNDGSKLNNCLIYGNNIVNPNPDALRGLISLGGNGSAALNQYTNIIALGVRPFTPGAGYYLRVLDDNKCFVNVYTDQDCSAMANYSEQNKTKFNFKDNLNAADLQGANAVVTASALDWDNLWFATENGLPELRVQHDTDLESVAKGYTGHYEACSCDIKGITVEHDYNNSYKCTVCEFTCDHNDSDHYVYTENAASDCITAGTYSKVCDCGFTDTGSLNDAHGHEFIVKAEVPSTDCQTQGTIAHKYCSVCKKNYPADADVMAAFDTAISDEDLKLPPAAHTALTDNSGIIYNMNENTHSKVCAVCTEEFDTENHVGSFVPDGANGHKGQCSVCMLDTSDEAAPHNFDGSTCTDCNWTCTDHNYIEGTIKAEGDCTNNRVVATYCSICKVAGADKVTTAPGHVEGEVQTENVVGADCENDGSHDEVIYCTACETELSRTTVTDDKLGHTEGEVQTENVVEADCENDGSHDEVIYCTVCETELSRTNVVDDKLGHTEGEVQTENVVEADCENDGSHDEVVYCTVCEEEISRTAVTDEKLGHELTKVVQVDATYDSVGTKEYYVCECGEKFADADGLTKVTDDELVIDKLVKEENDSTNNDAEEKPEGDTSDKSPETKDGFVSVAVVAALVGAAFISTRKFRNK